jgi:glycerol-3-phosphate acyltransferase PlsY
MRLIDRPCWHPVRRLVRVAISAVAGYLLGSVPVADLASGGVDLRAVGDRNPGWWNAREALGPKAAWPVLAGDIAKGAAGAAIGRLVARPGEWWMPHVGGGAAMVGHAWPLFARFRGGRSVATFGGAAGVISPLTAAASIATGAVAGRLTRSAACGIQAGFVAYPVVQLAVDGARRTAATGPLMSFIGLRFAMARG